MVTGVLVMILHVDTVAFSTVDGTEVGQHDAPVGPVIPHVMLVPLVVEAQRRG